MLSFLTSRKYSTAVTYTLQSCFSIKSFLKSLEILNFYDSTVIKFLGKVKSYFFFVLRSKLGVRPSLIEYGFCLMNFSLLIMLPDYYGSRMYLFKL